MDISKYIYDYLIEFNTSVIVPNLGSFSIIRKPSDIKDGVVVPPVKTVKFDSEKTEDDNVFTLYIAKKEDITHEQAINEVKKFYNYFFLNKLVSEKRPVTFDKFGTFTMGDNNNICFEPIADFFKDNFGLGNANIPAKQSQPEPVPVKPQVEPVKSAEPEPVKPVEPAPVKPAEPVKPEVPIFPVVPEPEPVSFKPAEPVKPDEPEKTASDSSLFKTGDNTRFRENTERRRPAAEKQEPPVPPKTSSPPPKKPVLTPVPLPKKKKKSGSSYLWILLVLILAAALGVGGYFAYRHYPQILSYIPFLNKEKEVEVEPLFPDEAEADEDAIDDTIDDETDMKNALNPDASKPTTQSQTTYSQPTTTYQSGNVDNGRYVLIIASFSTNSAAERYVKRLQNEGLNCEVVYAGEQRYRVSVASFNSLSEAKRQAEQIKSRPHCSDLWIANR